MKTTIKQLLAATALLLMTVNVSAEVYSGTCGGKVRWTLDTATGLLSIAGSGDIPDFVGMDTPWYYKGDHIEKVNIEDGITRIGNLSFCLMEKLTSVTIPASVTSIGREAFRNCVRLNSVYCLNPTPPDFENENTFDLRNYDHGKNVLYTYLTLHVPMGSKEIYSSAYQWRFFNKIKEDMEMSGKVYYVNLVVRQGTTGYTRQAIKADERLTIFIGSLGNNKVNTVQFNGADVTNDVVNGYYTTPEIKGESILSVSYEVENDIESMYLNDVKVRGYDGEITISNIDEPSDVYLYSEDGKLVGNIPSAFDSVSQKVTAGHVYIVKVGKRTYKVAL